MLNREPRREVAAHNLTEPVGGRLQATTPTSPETTWGSPPTSLWLTLSRLPNRRNTSGEIVGMAKRLPAKARPAEIVRLEDVRAEIAAVETVDEALEIEARARVLLEHAKQQQKLLRGATLDEAADAYDEAAQASRLHGATIILAKARLGELLPPKAKAGRTEIVPARVRFKPNELVRLRRLAALAPKHLDAYLAECASTDSIASPRGLLRWAKQADPAERAAERQAVVEEHVDEGGAHAWGDRGSTRYVDPTGADPYQRAADEVLQAAARLEARTREAQDAPIWRKIRDAAINELRAVAARLEQNARDRRESRA